MMNVKLIILTGVTAIILIVLGIFIADAPVYVEINDTPLSFDAIRIELDENVGVNRSNPYNIIESQSGIDVTVHFTRNVYRD